jgi:LuxR family transcriptional regulator/LuxR family quorum-sensing system transcriptional regulator CciR
VTHAQRKDSSGLGAEVHDFVVSCRHAATTGMLWQQAQKFARRLGIDMLTYHSLDVQRLGQTKLGIVEFGLPAQFKATYLSEKLYLIDPIAILASRSTDPFFWSDVPRLMSLTPIQARYLDYLKTLGCSDGIAVQVFGPQSRNALVTLHTGRANHLFSSDDLVELQWACQVAHLRFCALNAKLRSAYPQLSPRETDVLRWIARGKTNLAIAQIMGLSRHTVDTITRRMFDKLRVTDRTTAVVRGIASGEINQAGDMLM